MIRSKLDLETAAVVVVVVVVVAAVGQSQARRVGRITEAPNADVFDFLVAEIYAEIDTERKIKKFFRTRNAKICI